MSTQYEGEGGRGTYAPTVSSGSAGRITCMLGNVRSDVTVST